MAGLCLNVAPCLGDEKDEGRDDTPRCPYLDVTGVGSTARAITPLCVRGWCTGIFTKIDIKTTFTIKSYMKQY